MIFKLLSGCSMHPCRVEVTKASHSFMAGYPFPIILITLKISFLFPLIWIETSSLNLRNLNTFFNKLFLASFVNLRKQKFTVITNWGGGDYQLRSALAAKHIWVAVITHWGTLDSPPPRAEFNQLINPLWRHWSCVQSINIFL